MTYGELVIAARTWLRDMEGVADSNKYLTSAMALLFFNEALSEACRRSPLLMDSSTAAVCTITLVSGTASYALDERIVAIHRAKLTGRDRPLRKYSWRDLDMETIGWDTSTGDVSGYITDLDSGRIRFYRIPQAAGTVTLTVQRTPLTPLQNSSDIPEIASRYHYKLVPYVIAKLFDVEDSELYDPRKAARTMAQFDQEFGPPRAAWNESFENSQGEYEGTL